MALETSYTSRSAGSPGASGTASAVQGKTDYWPLSKLRRCYTDYLHSKREELDEQIDARRYYHGSQWTTEQLNIMKKRRQPVMTFNRIGRKIDAVVGQIEKLRQDPKAFARTPQHEEGAELATAVLRYVLDDQEWSDKSPDVTQDAAVDGIGGIVLELDQGDKGDPEVVLGLVDIQSFFYDPKSYKADFSDARYMGEGKWFDEDIAREMFPEGNFVGLSDGSDLTSNSDRETRWFSTEGTTKRVRIVDIWYRHKGGWCYAIFTGDEVLAEGRSYLQDEYQKDFCKYIMFSGNVDQDGDRYGFVRNLKSAQDGLNAKQSKMQHLLASNKLFISQGAVQDVEKTRAEMARPDGVIMVTGPVNQGVQQQDKIADFAGWDKLLERNIAEIEQYGPNLLGTIEGDQAKSGRAIALLQQSGFAELGPFILAHRGWKVRVYRAIWHAVQRHWQAERFVRVTDSDSLAHYLQINQVSIDPQTMQPTMVNAIGSLDVDIIIDEGPDTVNMMQDMYETLSNIVPAIAPIINPMVATQLVDMLINNSPLPYSSKQKFREAQQQAAQNPQPDPEMAKLQMQHQLEAASKEHEIMLSQQEQAANIQMQREEHIAKIEMMREESAIKMEAAQQQNAMQLQTQRESHEVDIEGQRQKNEMATTHEQDKVAAKTGAAPTSHNLKAMQEIAEGFKEGMALIAEAMTKPKQIQVQRDASGKVSGAIAA